MAEAKPMSDREVELACALAKTVGMLSSLSESRAGAEFVREQIKKVVADIYEVMPSLKHYHVAGTTAGLDIDTCAKCGLNIRNPIHHMERAP